MIVLYDTEVYPETKKDLDIKAQYDPAVDGASVQSLAARTSLQKPFGSIPTSLYPLQTTP